MRTRISFSFSLDGTHAACLSGGGDAPLCVERWSFNESAVDRRVLSTQDGETTWTQVLSVAGGPVLFTRPGNGIHRLVLAEPVGTGLAERTLMTIECPAVRLLATPASGVLALAVSRADDRSIIWRIPPAEPRPQRVAELPGMLSGGSWLDERGDILALTQHLDGVARPIAVDLRRGTARPVPGTSPGQHLLLGAPRSGLLLLAEDPGDGWRLDHGPAGYSPRFPGLLSSVTGSVAPMAVDPRGESVALRVNQGVRSHLMIYTPGRDRIREIDIPPGVMHSTGRWTGQGLRFPFSAPAQPTGIATVDVATGRWNLAADGHGTGLVDAAVREFPGPDGPVEAVVYGDVRQARQVLVSLHGGPEAAAQLSFDPLTQTLARAGIAVVAPNYRGSTGYGLAHQRAVHGAWGGPDLADVRYLARELAREGRQLIGFGTSYGAFLALLAASADPGLWSHCVAVSPFLSGPRLYEQGSPGVRALIDRLGGRTAIDDGLGPRDLTRLADRITARLLIVHGANDDVIPVSQSRELRRCLLRAGRREGRDFTYLEPATGGHDPMHGHDGNELTGRLLQFLRAGKGGEPGQPGNPLDTRD